MQLERRYNSDLYNLDCLQATIYKLSKIISVKIDKINNEFVCLISFLNSDLDQESVVKQFDQELIDQELRRTIANQTETYRTIILSLAFSKTGLQSDG
jgi:His-Xaa-Ser system protein HxsD